jgi:penicillin amidase
MGHPVYIVKNRPGIASFVLFLLSAAAEIVILVLFCVYVLYACRFCQDSMAILILLGAATVVLFLLCAWTYFRSVYKELKSSSTKEFLGNVELEPRSSESNELELPEDVTYGKPAEVAPSSRKCRFQPRYLLYGLTLLLSLFLLITTIGFILFSNASLPQVNGTMSLKGLTDTVTIYREPNGMIHIVASNELDAIFAQGVVSAQERLWQMEFNRRLGQGTLSEVLGPSALSLDKFSRLLGLYNRSISDYSALSSNMAAAINAYIQGVNSYLATNPPLPFEFSFFGFKPAPWVPADVLVWGKLISWDLSANFDSESLRYQLMTVNGISLSRIEELIPAYPSNAPTVLQPQDLNVMNPLPAKKKRAVDTTEENVAEKRQDKISRLPLEQIYREFVMKQRTKQNAKRTNLNQARENILSVVKSYLHSWSEASNNWVVSGNLTTTGKPFLCNDPHLSFSAPMIWMLVHLQTPQMNLIGASFPGTPYIVLGRNDWIAWGATNSEADIQDLYVIDEVDSNGYFYKGVYTPYTIRNEPIVVKGPSGTSTVDYTVKETVYGPIVDDLLNPNVPGPVALHWVSIIEPDTTFEAFYDLNHAQNFTAFRNALQKFVAPAQNFVYADIYGNIGYQLPGLIPIRVPGDTGMIPMPGNGSYDWLGYIPFDSLPFTLNPSEGFIVSANNKITPSNYNYTILNDYDWKAPFRAERITELIQATPQLSLNDMIAIQLDQKSLFFDTFLRQILITAQPQSEGASIFRTYLLLWDANVTANTAYGAIYTRWYDNIRTLTQAETGIQYWPYPLYFVNTFNYYLYVNFSLTQQYLTFIENAFENALLSLNLQTQGAQNNVQWGSIHAATFQNPIFAGTSLNCIFERSVPFGGDTWTVNVGPWDPTTNYDMFYGASYRQVIDLSNMNNSLFIMPMGQSENIFSSFYDNWLPLWTNGSYLSMADGGYQIWATLTLQPTS